jgi:hypothetical protein
MDISQKDLAAFIEDWFLEFGERLSEKEARYRALRLLQLFAALSRAPAQPGGWKARECSPGKNLRKKSP